MPVRSRLRCASKAPSRTSLRCPRGGRVTLAASVRRFPPRRAPAVASAADDRPGRRPVPGRLRQPPTRTRCGSCARPGARCPSTGPSGARAASSTPSAARAGGRDHPSARAPLRRRRRHPLQRHRRARARHRLRRRRRPRHRPRRRRALPARRRPRPPPPAGARARHALRARDRPHPGRGADRPADRVRRRPLHRRQLPDRGPPVPHLRAHQGPDVRRRAALARPARPPGRPGRRPRCAARWRAAPRRCSCSTRGPARSRPPTTRATCSPTARVFAALADLGVPRIHFGVDTGELLGLMAEAGADVVGVDWRTPLDEASHRRRGRCTVGVQGNLDPRRASARGRWCGPRRPRSWPATAAGPATSSTSATACCRRPTPPSSPAWWRRSTGRRG